MGTPDASTINVATLGRPFSLGMLYDCRSESLVPGVTLWDSDTLKKDIRDSNIASSKVTTIISDTLEEKSHALDIGAELKVC